MTQQEQIRIMQQQVIENKIGQLYGRRIQMQIEFQAEMDCIDASIQKLEAQVESLQSIERTDNGQEKPEPENVLGGHRQ